MWVGMLKVGRGRNVLGSESVRISVGRNVDVGSGS